MVNREDVGRGLLVNDKGLIERVIYRQIDIDNLLKSGIQATNLEYSYVYPGFTDTHTHSFEGGLYANAADLEEAKSIADVLEILLTTQEIDGYVMGYHLDESRLKEKRFPTLLELDKAFPDKPCMIRRIDGHSSVINSKTYQLSKLREQADKHFDKSERNQLDSFNGVLRTGLNDFISGWFHKSIGKEGIIAAYKRAALKAVSKGHTTVHTMIGDGKNDLMHLEMMDNLLKDNEDYFPVEFVLYPQVFNVSKAHLINSKRVGGCVLADGSFGSGTAALTQPYLNSKNKGILYKTDDEWYRFIKEGHRQDMQVAIHCIGDAAVKQILELYVRVQNEEQKDLRHQIIHCELITDESVIQKMAENNIAAVMQPMFDRLWGGNDKLYANVLGIERAMRCNRFNSMIKAGILITGGSDWYVTDIDALAGIDAAVNLHNPAERISPYQAVQLYTSNAARLIREEDKAGTLQKDRRADFVCLERDIMIDKSIKSIPVKYVYRKGRQVFKTD